MKRLTIACCLAAAMPGAHGLYAQQMPAVAAGEDAMFREPYIDKDEWRDAPVRHRYVHGGFKGTQTRFSFYLPPKAQYQGRFFQHITPVPDDETLAQAMPLGEENKIAFAIASGGYFVETNGGSATMLPPAAEPALTAYRANAAAARYSRVVARAMYGGGRPYGYAYGGSGGGFRTVGSIENTDGVWDGVVPYVLGSPMAPPNLFSVRMRAMRILNDKFPQIMDAVEPGGSGDPYAGLTPVQASVLREATRMGFPQPSWFGWRTMGIHGFAALYGGMLAADPGYFTDFWSNPGYLGHDDPKSFDGYRLQQDATIAAPITAIEAAGLNLDTSIVNGTKNGGVDNAFGKLQGEGARRIVGFRLSQALAPIYFVGGDLIVASGAAKGQRLTISRIAGDVVILGIADAAVAAQIQAGDAVRIDNSNFLAAETYHWHQVPPADAGYPVWDQFRKPDGTPLYPQRAFLLGPLFAGATTGKPMGQPPMSGTFKGKMILVENLWDREAMPWQGDWYRRRVQASLGAATDANFRLWYVDHALHGDSADQEDPTRTVSYLGVLQQALRDLSLWVEKGVAPPAGTDYRIDDGQVIVPATAAARHGIQPVVAVSANGKAKADIGRGQTVRFTATIEVPPGTGSIVEAAWDFEGSGTFPVKATLPASAKGKVSLTASHVFATPGTYYPALRVASERNGDAASPYARIQNLGRVRVVVE